VVGLRFCLDRDCLTYFRLRIFGMDNRDGQRFLSGVGEDRSGLTWKFTEDLGRGCWALVLLWDCGGC